MTRGILCVLCVLCGAFATAQNYKCDWSVVGIGGGEMAGAYECGATAGQTAAGLITGSSYWALIGFWLPEEQTGVREQAYSPSGQPLTTRLYSPFPTPFRTAATIRYSLAAEGRVPLRVHDLSGRVVRTLADGEMERQGRPRPGTGAGRLLLPVRGGRHANDTEARPRAPGRRTGCGGRRGPAPAPLHPRTAIGVHH